MGCALQQGVQVTIGRNAVLASNLPVTVPAQSIDRQCSSGMMAIGMAAKQIIADNQQIVIGGGVESISMVQTAEMRVAPDMNKFDDEIVALPSTMSVKNKETGEVSQQEVTLSKDEGNRPSTTLEGLSGLKPVRGPEAFITAGNASQLSDGASVSVLMEGKEASKRGLNPLGIYRGMAVAGLEPDEMGIGPVFAIPKLLKANGLKMDDIDLWELNEAFAVQVIYCRDKLGIPMENMNVNGGAISIGHPYGMSGARMVAHALIVMLNLKTASPLLRARVAVLAAHMLWRLPNAA